MPDSTPRLQPRSYSQSVPLVLLALRQVDTDLDLFRAIDKHQPGERVTVLISRLVNRGGVVEAVEVQLNVVLQESPSVNGDTPLDRNWGVRG